MRSYLRPATTLLLAGAALACGSAADGGGETAGFARRIRDALESRTPQAVSELYCWDGIDPEARAEEAQRNLILLKGPVKEVSFQPLPEGFQSEFEVGGFHYRPNVPITGRVKLLFASATPQDAVGGVTVPYSHEGDRFCFPVIQRSRSTPVGRRELIVGVSVPEGAPLSYSINCSYVVTGVLRTLSFEATAPRSETLNGEFVHSCRVQKRSSGGFVELTIEEGGVKVFESRSEGEPIVYPSP